MLCSGYRVFPDGTKCPGCRDCMMPPAAAQQLIDDMQAAVDHHGGKLPWWDQPDNKQTEGQQ